MRHLIASAILAAGTLPVLAQSTPAPASTGSPAAPFRASITVTATTEPEPADRVPATVTVVDAAEIADRQAAEAIPLLRAVPGLAVTRGGSPGKVASLFTRGTNSSHTLFLWNGVTLNDPYLGGFDLSTLSIDGVERLEVARGPFSALYGSSAVGGVVQVITRGGGRELGARLEGGSNEHRLGALAAGAPLGELDLHLAGHARRGEGEVANDSWEGEELALALAAGRDTSWRVGLRARVLASDLGIPHDSMGTATPRRRQELDALSLALPAGWTDGTLELEAQLAATETDLEVADPDDPFAASAAEARREQARLLARRAIGSVTWTLGGDWEEATVDSSSAFGPGLAGERQRARAAFVQGSFARGALRADVGLRRDEQDAFGGATSLRAAAAIALGERARLRLGYGESFRAPSLADLYYPGFSNPELDAERGESAELALEVARGPLRAELALFANELDSLIEFDFRTFRPENLGRARARGVEGAVALRRGILDARLAATWLDAEDRATGRPLLRRPDESASLILFLRPGAWTLGAVANHVGERTDFGDVALPRHTTLDLSVARRLGERFEPYARVENVADARYEEAAGFPAPGRALVVGGRARF